MGSKEENIQFDVRGNIFEINGTWTYDPDNWRPGIITVNLSNGAGKWISLIVESVYPSNYVIWDSNRLNHGSQVGHDEPLILHRGQTIHIKRWAPGPFGIPGDGGGEIFFSCPDTGDVVINITCNG